MSSCTALRRSPSPVFIPWIENGSPMIEPTVLRGFSDEYGSWKIICASRRNSISSLGEMSAISRPSNLIEPLVGSSRRSSSRPVVDLPQPDSPTSPSVSPRLTSNDTPSTACTAPTCLRKMIPEVSGKCFLRSRISYSVSPPPTCAAARDSSVAAAPLSRSVMQSPLRP